MGQPRHRWGSGRDELGSVDALGPADAKSLDEEKAAIERVNKAALDFVVYAPTGFFLSYQAWRKNISGVVKGPLPFFWGVAKTV